MVTEIETRGLRRDLAVLEERMNTIQTEYKSGFDRLSAERRADAAERKAAFERLSAERQTDIAEHRARIAEFETRLSGRIAIYMAVGFGLMGMLMWLLDKS
ncbi:MAG: hypothetical protein ACR2P9_02620 [Gammaproteobacteria bacterium]